MLGSFLHEVLTRIKAEPLKYTKIELFYDAKDPVHKPVQVGLPANGIRLQFDGPEQRLRLIEVLDFTKNHITFKPSDKEIDLVRPQPSEDSGHGKSKTALEQQAGPTFRHIYHRFLGPTYPGEYIPDKSNSRSGTFVLSYPGVAFTFSMRSDVYSAHKDNIALMSKSEVQVASSMAIFHGESWADARSKMWTEILPSLKTFPPLTKGGDTWPDEVSLIRLHGGGQVQMMRLWSDKCNWIRLGHTREADIRRALGAPDAIYRKNDHKMDIHKGRAASHGGSRSRTRARRGSDILSDTDQSSTHLSSDGYDSTGETMNSSSSSSSEEGAANLSSEYFWNYFYLGFDILFSPRKPSSPPPPTKTPEIVSLGSSQPIFTDEVNVATKLILHSNVPGSYPFNRHRRVRWEIAYLNPDSSPSIQNYNSETPFDTIKPALLEEWKDVYQSEETRAADQRGMALNRGWGDSPGSSIEFMGGWEEEKGGRTPGIDGASKSGKRFEGGEESTTTLFGFPGLVFEVLRNGYVSALTVF